MPPLYPHDPLAAVERGAAWRWVELPGAFAGVAGEPWVLALVALALYAWLEQEVRDVLAAFLPLALALAVSAAIALGARSLGEVPRPVGGAAEAAAPLLRALGGGHASSVFVLAAYSVLAYGRRARAAVLFAAAFAAGRAVSGPGWGLELCVGALLGTALAAAGWAATLKVFPEGRLARLRRTRRSAGALPRAVRPSP